MSARSVFWISSWLGKVQRLSPERSREAPSRWKTPLGLGLELLAPGQADGLGVRPGLVAPARLGQVGGEELHLGAEVLGPRPAGEGEGVVADAEGDAHDLAGQGLVDLLGGQVLQAAFGVEALAERPHRARPVARLVEAALAGAHRDQDLVLVELGRLHRQAHAVGEAHEGGVEIGDVASSPRPGRPGRSRCRARPWRLRWRAGRPGRAWRRRTPGPPPSRRPRPGSGTRRRPAGPCR